MTNETKNLPFPCVDNIADTLKELYAVAIANEGPTVYAMINNYNERPVLILIAKDITIAHAAGMVESISKTDKKLKSYRDNDYKKFNRIQDQAMKELRKLEKEDPEYLEEVVSKTNK